MTACPACGDLIRRDGRAHGGLGYEPQEHGCSEEQIEDARRAHHAEIRARMDAEQRRGAREVVA